MNNANPTRPRAGTKLLESVLLALLVALAIGFVAFNPTVALADDDEEEEEEEHGNRGAAGRPTAADAPVVAAWKAECGSCHVPFPARSLPAASWQKMMGNLGDHFGTDATMDDAALTKKMTEWLVRNAGDPAKYRDTKGGAVPLRVTETRWFVREHDEVRADVWKRPSIKTASNCGACHKGAADGRFGEREIRIPKQ